MLGGFDSEQRRRTLWIACMLHFHEVRVVNGGVERKIMGGRLLSHRERALSAESRNEVVHVRKTRPCEPRLPLTHVVKIRAVPVRIIVTATKPLLG